MVFCPRCARSWGLHALSLVLISDFRAGQALARLHASVVGVDAGDANIDAARQHAALDPDLSSQLEYRATTAEALVREGGAATFDVVVASEVIEHVADVPLFVNSLFQLARPGGAVVVTTISRNAASFLGAILAAEYLLRLLPVGTHDWAKFLTPEELQQHLRGTGLEVEGPAIGLHYDPLRGRWSRSPIPLINYAIVARRPSHD